MEPKKFCKVLEKQIKPIYGENWSKRQSYDTIFTSLKYHGVVNKVEKTNYLHDEDIVKVRPTPEPVGIV